MNYVIFSSVPALAVMALIAVIYILTAFLKSNKSKALCMTIAVVNIIAHLMLMALFVYLKATLAEFMFFFVASTAVSLIVSVNRRESK